MANVEVKYCGETVIPNLNIAISNTKITINSRANFKKNGIKFTWAGSNVTNVEIDFDPNKNSVPDVWRYVIDMDKYGQIQVYEHDKTNCLLKNSFIEESQFKDVESDVTWKDCPEKTIVLLLESPHKDEYTEFFAPKAPAQGSTGDNIGKEIANLLFLLLNKNEYKSYGCCKLKNERYKLILANPVQYQTSLSILYDEKIDKIIRNSVWKSLWNYVNVKGKKVIQEHFKNRIIKYKPCLIINSCTKDDKKNDTIYNFLVDLYAVRLMSKSHKLDEMPIIINTHHPSYWSGFGLKS